MHINHIALNVRNLEDATRFFCKYFGAKIDTNYHNPRTGLYSHFLSFPDGDVRLELMQWCEPDSGTAVPSFTQKADDTTMPAGNTDSHATGYQHLSISVGSKERVDELTAQLAADGYPCVNGPRYTGEHLYESVIILHGGEELELTI